MARLINPHALETNKIDSAALGQMAMIGHPIADPGRYEGRVYQGKEPVARFILDVVKDEGAPQADIDLGRVVPMPGSGKGPNRYRLSAGGYVLFYVSQGRGGYRVELLLRPAEGSDDAEPKRTFNSAELGKGDLFVLSLIRPGTWSLEERGTRAQAKIQVAYPALGPTPFRPKDQATVLTLGDQGLSSDGVEHHPGEGVVVQVEGQKARFLVALDEADDGPDPNRRAATSDDRPRRRVRWNNPRAERR